MSRAILIPETGPPGVLRPSELPTPEPAAGEVLIRNHTGAVNFIDTIIRRGEMPEGLMPALPHVPGVEGAGVIEALGPGVEGFVVGDRVAWMGPIGAGGYGSHSVIRLRKETFMSSPALVTGADQGLIATRQAVASIARRFVAMLRKPLEPLDVHEH